MKPEPAPGPSQLTAQTTRRSLLRGITVASLVAPASHVLGQLEVVTDTDLIDDLPRGIDSHVHVWTPDTKAYPLAAGYRRDEMVPASFTPDQLMEHAKPCGVRRVVLVQMSFYGFDNAYMLDTIAKYPGVYSGIAVIDDEAERPQTEMLRLKGLGVRGFRIYPRNLPPDRWLDGAGMQQMWRWGAQQRLAMCHLINPDALPAIDAMCGRYPDTPVVIDHLARIGVDGQIRDEDVAALCRLARHKQTHVKVSAFYALGKKQPPHTDLAPLIRRVYEAFGPERLMWGSDCPYQVDQQKYCDSVDLIRSRLDFLSESDRQWLLWRTAERLFFG
jgi:predicted TIM-barrel fold metal-dependent hydrolase